MITLLCTFSNLTHKDGQNTLYRACEWGQVRRTYDKLDFTAQAPLHVYLSRLKGVPLNNARFDPVDRKNHLFPKEKICVRVSLVYIGVHLSHRNE
ncbi:hypothetical protein [Nostoc sp.]|uniref:hypothetical protein n=1 Tax=Nostoc sp. TaxID=1180 RepID=UPI002FF9AE5D